MYIYIDKTVSKRSYYRKIFELSFMETLPNLIMTVIYTSAFETFIINDLQGYEREIRNIIIFL